MCLSMNEHEQCKDSTQYSLSSAALCSCPQRSTVCVVHVECAAVAKHAICSTLLSQPALCQFLLETRANTNPFPFTVTSLMATTANKSRKQLTHMHAHSHTCTHTHSHTHTRTVTHAHTYAHSHMHTYTHTCMHTHAHTHARTHARTHTHTHTHTHTDRSHCVVNQATMSLLITQHAHVMDPLRHGQR